MTLSYASITAKTSTNDTAAAPHSVDAPVPVPAPRSPKAPVTASSTKAPVPAPRTKDTMGLLPSEPSICIARVPTSFNDGQLIGICQDELNLGKVNKVDIIQKTDKNGNDYLMVFIHFTAWNCEDEGADIRRMLMNDEKVKIIYDEPHYLTLSKSYTSKSNSKRANPKNNKRSKPRVVMDEEGWTQTPVYNKKSTQTHATQPEESSSQTKDSQRNAVNAFAGLDLEE